VVNAAPPAELTEGHFRSKLWKGTRGSERERFQDAWDRLAD
jgi:hypothetical protein